MPKSLPAKQGSEEKSSGKPKVKKTAIGVKIQNAKKKRQFKGREKGR